MCRYWYTLYEVGVGFKMFSHRLLPYIHIYYVICGFQPIIYNNNVSNDRVTTKSQRGDF